jgi:hypothetical protein
VSNVTAYNVLREASRDQRTTIADAIDVLETEANFKPDDCVAAGLSKMIETSSSQLQRLKPDRCGVGFVVPLRTAKAIIAVDMDDCRKQLFEMELLDGATTNASGVTSLANGDDESIPHLTVSMIKGAESRCYRYFRRLRWKLIPGSGRLLERAP